MNHLIIVPRIINRIGYWYQFPLGIAYVTASLRKHGFNVVALNLNNTDQKIRDILEYVIKEKNIDTVLTGGLTGQYGAIKQILKYSKNIKPNIVTIVGGGIITSAPENAMEALELADYGVIGEGEITCCTLCEHLEKGESIEGIPALIYKRQNTFSITSGKAKPVDIENIPFPDYEAFGFDTLLKTAPNIIGMCDQNTLPIITSRGCPYNCTFCFHPSGIKFRQRSLDSVFNEIEYLVGRFNVKYFSIQDELFGHDMDRVCEFCKRIKPYGIHWLAQFRVTDITEDLVKTLKDANCRTIGFGIESADNRILRSMKKNITIEETERALDIVYRAGIGIQGVLIFGDPAETEETYKNTIKWWKKHIHYELQLSSVIAYPGTEVYEYACQKNIITDRVKYIRDGCPLVKLAKMTDQEYASMTEQILSLPRKTHGYPREVKIENIDYNLAKIIVRGLCSSCGAENEWHHCRLFILETLACRKCGKKHIAPIPDKVSANIDESVRLLIEKFGLIAFWGINSYFYHLFSKVKRLTSRGVCFVDKSEVRRNTRISSKRIETTERISELGIKCVVVSVPQYYSGIALPIVEEYPQVEKLLCITDLLNPERFR